MDRFPILHFPIYATWIAAFKVVARSGTSEFRAGWTGAHLLCHSLATVMLGLAAQQKLICRPNDYDVNKNSCRQPYMSIYDLGYTFGADRLRVYSLNFEKWKQKSY